MTKPGGKQVPWTQEDIEILRRERESGKTAGEIAEILGRTKIAVWSKIDLLKIKSSHNNRGRKKSAVPTWELKRPPETFKAFGSPKTLLDLGPNECLFMPDGMTKFCAAPSHGPYCHRHKKICYVSG